MTPTPTEALVIGQQLATLQREQDAAVAVVRGIYRAQMASLHAAYIRTRLAARGEG